MSVGYLTLVFVCFGAFALALIYGSSKTDPDF